MTPSFKDTVSFDDVTVVRSSDKALLVSIPEHDDGKPIWIPQSHIHDDSEVYKEGTSGTLVISEWIATEKGLV